MFDINTSDIRFPNLGIVFHNVKEGISVFGFEIKFYGMIIAFGFLLAYFIVSREAKRTGQNEENYLDLILWLIVPAIVGARLYYIIFSPGEFFVKGRGLGKTLLAMINIRNGGLAIYGGVIAGFTVAYIFCKNGGTSLTEKPSVNTRIPCFPCVSRWTISTETAVCADSRTAGSSRRLCWITPS